MSNATRNRSRALKRQGGVTTDSRPARGPSPVTRGKSVNRRLLVGLILLSLAFAVAWLLLSRRHNGSTTVGAGPSPAPSSFEPTIPNSGAAPAQAPEGMVWIPGGEFSMGANDPPDMDDVGMKATLDARPIHRVYVDSFFMDKTDVTNSQFAEFVKATGYVTIAERTPRAEDFPGAPPKIWLRVQWFSLRRIMLSPSTTTSSGGTTCTEPTGGIRLGRAVTSGVKKTIPWCTSPMLTRRPTRSGRESACQLKPNGSLRRAAVLAGQPFVWGDAFRPNGKWMANTHQGHFPNQDTGEDGYVGIAPVAQYPPTDMGCTTWRAMSGSGPATGIARTTTSNWPRPAKWRATRKVRIHPSTPVNRTSPRKCIGEARTSVPISIVRVTSWALGGKEKAIPGPITSAFAASKTSRLALGSP